MRTFKERYRSDDAFRLKKNRTDARYYRSKAQPKPALTPRQIALQDKIHAATGRIYNARKSIRHHEERAAFYFSRLTADLALVDILREQKQAAGSDTLSP